jgi:hypothetical protein
VSAGADSMAVWTTTPAGGCCAPSSAKTNPAAAGWALDVARSRGTGRPRPEPRPSGAEGAARTGPAAGVGRRRRRHRRGAVAAAAQRSKRTGPPRGARAAVSELATVRRVDAGTRAQRRRGRFARPRRPGGAEVAARPRAPETRRTYAAVYRTFAAFLGPQATAEDPTPEAVRAYRERAGRSPATVARLLSALRDLAAAVGADQAVSDLARKFAHVCGVRTHLLLRGKQARVRRRRGGLRLVQSERELGAAGDARLLLKGAVAPRHRLACRVLLVGQRGWWGRRRWPRRVRSREYRVGRGCP